MKFLDLAKVQIRSGAGGNGCDQFPAREVRRVRRPRRRRRRPRRRRLGRGGGRAQHPHRLPLPAALLRAERAGRHGQPAHRHGRRRHRAARARRHRDPRGGRGDGGGRPHRAGRPRRCSPGAATAAWATCTSRPRPTARRAAPTRASRGSSGRSGCGSSSSPTRAWWGCRTPASRPSSPRSRTRGPRSPTTRSRRWCRTSASSRWTGRSS